MSSPCTLSGPDEHVDEWIFVYIPFEHNLNVVQVNWSRICQRSGHVPRSARSESFRSFRPARWHAGPADVGLQLGSESSLEAVDFFAAGADGVLVLLSGPISPSSLSLLLLSFLVFSLLLLHGR